MRLSGWGKYPIIDVQVTAPDRIARLIDAIETSSDRSLIARGSGRSYGDSSLANFVVSTRYLDHLIGFDDSTGQLTSSAGTSLAEILRIFAPRGWFLPVTPGTKFVTVGGAIASDVHGKNHHLNGSFCDHLESLRIVLPSGKLLTCSETENSELFHATCGGMGLTGVIVDATFRLKKIFSSLVDEIVIKAKDLSETLDLFDAYHESSYSVAWIDCLATGTGLGRSLVILGEHSQTGGLTRRTPGNIFVPFDSPSALMNRYTAKAFNTVYYHKNRRPRRSHQVHYETFFYPLDAIGHWNRLYGKKGFVQYQFLLPRDSGRAGLREILDRIGRSGRGAFLAVLKAFGQGNQNFLSFPTSGYTLALDFKLERGLLPFLDQLDRIVLEHGGRIYLAKDARMSEATFKAGYPKWEHFSAVRAAHGCHRTFNSHQSLRLGL